VELVRTVINQVCLPSGFFDTLCGFDERGFLAGYHNFLELAFANTFYLQRQVKNLVNWLLKEKWSLLWFTYLRT